MSGQSKASCKSSVKFRPVNNGFLIIFEIESDFDIVGHEGGEVDFGDFDNVSDEGPTGPKHEGPLSSDDS